jgi:putative endonuclease
MTGSPPDRWDANALRGHSASYPIAVAEPSVQKKTVIAGLDPAIHLGCALLVRTYYVYIIASRKNGTLYIGVTGDIARRAFEHREELLPGFTKRYGVKLLVHIEPFGDIRVAIQREKNLKKWPRAWKIALIEETNPDWHDLYAGLV